MDPTYPLFPIFAFIGFILVLIPLPWHLQAWNSGTCLFMIWTAVACLNQFINSIVWRDNAIDWAPVWCDISSRLIVGIAVGIPAASLCINRRLYKIATCTTVTLTQAHKRRAVMVDLAIGLGIPALQMILQFVVQGHRYDIYEEVGCYPTTVNTAAAYPLSFVWPIAIALVSAVYCILTLRAFMIRRAQFSQFLSSNTSLTTNRYFRLMALATVELLLNTPINIYGLYINLTWNPIYPWISWANIHSDWYIIGTYPSILWRSDRIAVVSMELSRWLIILCALVFFAFFGFAQESRKNYRRGYTWVAQRVRFLPPLDGSPKTGLPAKGVIIPLKNTSGTLPVFMPRPPNTSSSFQSSSSLEKGDLTTSKYPSTIISDYTHNDSELPSSSPTSATLTFYSESHSPVKRPVSLS